MALPMHRLGALLGPTNTGKTHRAIQRMLAHRTGMFGLPLRLLAREVYDRVCLAVGTDAVALVTGEEKILPAEARYFVCTVEAMPTSRVVDFVAIDEVQLAADRQRGHVFTDRILHARGARETLLLGSETIAGLLLELLPGLQIESAPRLSELTHDGTHRVGRLPRRSAVVTFSAERVVQLAEHVKAAHGGTAVVLGALSPRTRNAQVALYQAGEVDHLVATDAIGMGLNLDVDHVVLDAVRKFDGRSVRDLTSAEVGQIAGRAGRHRRPGRFGSLRPLELGPELVEAVESHRFPPVRRIFWRNSQLDLGSVDALLASLERPPPHRALLGIQGEDDQHVLARLAADEALMARVGDPDAVARLWEVCRVPDFRKTLTDAHVRLLREIAWTLLGPRGRLEPSWIEARLDRLDQPGGDIDTLMGRLAWVRTWTYITFRGDWVDDAPGLQQRTRAIEDRLSDALHAVLRDRFVDRAVVVARSSGEVDVAADGAVRLGGVRVGEVVGMDFVAAPVAGELVSAARARLGAHAAGWVEALEACDDASITVDAAGSLHWRGGALARLAAGPDLRSPTIRLGALPLLDASDKDRVRVRLQRWVDALVTGLVGPLRPSGRLPPAVRGVLFRLEEGLGTAPAATLDEALAGLDDGERRALARRGVRLGRWSAFLPTALKPARVRDRAALVRAFHGAAPEPPPPSATAAPADAADEAAWWLLGFPVVGGLAVRADVLEACAAELRQVARGGAFDLPDAVRARLAVDEAAARAFIRGLGYAEVAGRFVPTGRRPRRQAR